MNSAPSIDELLLPIVHGAYLHSRGADGVSWDPAYDKLNMSTDILFPFNLMLASTRFKAVLSATPEYWTYLFIFIDSDPTESLEWLSWSANLAIDVVVKRRAFANIASDLAERDRLRQVMNQINIHLPRIKSLRVFSLHSSSLPSLVLDFRGGADRLQTLELRSVLDDWEPLFFLGEERTFEELHAITLRSRFESPFTKLDNLIINGRNFVELCFPTANGDHITYLAGVRQLGIFNYTFRTWGGVAWTLSCIDMLEVVSVHNMPKLMILALCGIHFENLGLDECCGRCNNAGAYLLGITHLLLKDVDPPVMNIFQSDMVDAPHLALPELVKMKKAFNTIRTTLGSNPSMLARWVICPIALSWVLVRTSIRLFSAWISAARAVSPSHGRNE